MARRRSKPVSRIAGKYPADTVNTIEFPELFHVLRSGKVRNSLAVNQESCSWNGNLSWIESLDAAELGKWEAPKIESITLPEISGTSEDVRYFYDVTGNSFDVAAYLSGEPECWLVEEPVIKPCGRVIRLAVEIGGNQSIAAESMANRGQAIIALINSLELAGNSVELTIVRAYKNDRDENYKFLIPIKHAGQSIDMKRIQFMIGNPAFYRRCLFGLAEIAHGESLYSCSTSTRSYQPEGFLHIPSYEGLSESLENSLEWAKRFARNLDKQSIAA